MKNYFKNIFKKKYPQRVDEDIKNMRVLYAGPAFRNKRKRMECVYAGPEMMGRIRRRDTEMEDVYAGPSMDDPEEITEEEDI